MKRIAELIIIIVFLVLLAVVTIGFAILPFGVAIIIVKCISGEFGIAASIVICALLIYVLWIKNNKRRGWYVKDVYK